MRALVISLLFVSQLALAQGTTTSKPRAPAKVYVYDQMSSPVGIVIGSSGLTALQALATTKGLESTARLRLAEIIRRTKNGHRRYPVRRSGDDSAESPGRRAASK
jgi:hypothetical protein